MVFSNHNLKIIKNYCYTNGNPATKNGYYTLNIFVILVMFFWMDNFL